MIKHSQIYIILQISAIFLVSFRAFGFDRNLLFNRLKEVQAEVQAEPLDSMLKSLRLSIRIEELSFQKKGEELYIEIQHNAAFDSGIEYRIDQDFKRPKLSRLGALYQNFTGLIYSNDQIREIRVDRFFNSSNFILQFDEQRQGVETLLVLNLLATSQTGELFSINLAKPITALDVYPSLFSMVDESGTSYVRNSQSGALDFEGTSLDLAHLSSMEGVLEMISSGQIHLPNLPGKEPHLVLDILSFGSFYEGKTVLSPVIPRKLLKKLEGILSLPEEKVLEWLRIQTS